jgi:exopolysaccharide biosynthesis polyprenyl glycosylphosphotransferase
MNNLQEFNLQKSTSLLVLENLAKENFEDKSYKLMVRNFDLSLRKPFQWFLKRIFDITAAIAGIIILSPIFALIAVLIKIDSRGPVFYKQVRIGVYGREFNMYKFRSMRQAADKELDKIKVLNETNEVMFKLFNDPRVTRIGKFIRKYSIDELPQLINVLKGEMSLVGPRPSIKHELERYKKFHHLRLATIPGLTGVWQVSGRSNIKTFDKVLELDYEYITNWNFLTDIKLIFKTIPVVLFAKDAA